MSLDPAGPATTMESSPPKPFDALKKENPSLHRILLGINELDDAIGEADSEAQINLLEDGKAKVDGYKRVIDKLKMEAAYHKEQADEHLAMKKSAESAISRIQKNLIYALSSNQFTKFTGFKYVVKLQRAAPSVETNIATPTTGMKIKYDRYIRTKYEWDKAAIAEGLKADDPAAQEIAAFRETIFPKFSPAPKEGKPIDE